MKRTIILSAGHGGNDPGAVSGKYIERDLALELRELIAARLVQAGFKVLKDQNQNKLADTLKWLVGKYSERDILIDIHWNAGQPQANGTEVIIPQTPSVFEQTLATELVNAIHSIGFKNRGVKKESQTARKTLAWMRPKAENILIEVCFISNSGDMNLYINNKEELACLISETIIKVCKKY